MRETLGPCPHRCAPPPPVLLELSPVTGTRGRAKLNMSDLKLILPVKKGPGQATRPQGRGLQAEGCLTPFRPRGRIR